MGGGTGRVRLMGKYLSVDGRRFRMRGATYGTFARRRDGALFPDPAQLHADIAAMAQAGLNVIRTYTVPPQDLLDAAAEFGLRVLAGIDYDDWRMEPQSGLRTRRRIRAAGRSAVEAAMERLAGRPEVLAVVVGNEVPGDLVRVHGIRAVEETLATLCADVHAADPELLATYANYPTTEYLAVDGQDFASFNVFLERPEQLRAYLGHLQVAVGEIPLVLTEVGLASGLHGEQAQAEALEWQLRLVEETGCAGAAVFSWTDEWEVAGSPVEGWDFGITDGERRPKPALEVVERWARSTVGDLRPVWPRVSVVVCAYNAAATIDECLASLAASDYPDLEVVVCDDGSSDGTRERAGRYPVRLLALGHNGLSAARNAGVEAASGDIIAFLDSDAACHSEWPYRLVLALDEPNVAAAGGPNLACSGAGFVERAVAASPGGPIHVLLSDDRAEHVPGCNMAFRRERLDEVGGFDPIFTAAGDDVDLCWKLLDRGHEIAFSPAAQVDHHRRASVRAYLRQQRGYGRAERLVAARHPHRFNGLGQARWAGFIYGGPRILASLLRPVVYHGLMGTAPFQAVAHRRSDAVLRWLSAMLPLAAPFVLLGLLAPFSLLWLIAPALVTLAVLAHVLSVAVAAHPRRGESHPVAFRLLVGVLHVAQPLARAWGRLLSRRGETPMRTWAWNGERETWLAALSRELSARRCNVRPGDAHDWWDLSASIGPFFRCRLTTAVVWRWSPVHRLALRLRLPALIGLFFATGAVATRSTLGIALAASFVGLLALESGLLWLAARHSLDATTRAAAAETRAAIGVHELEHALLARLGTSQEVHERVLD